MPWLLTVLVVAFVLRAIAAIAVQSIVDRTPGRLCLINGDADGYWKLARNIARGDEYSVYDPPRRVLRVPGFPLLLAASIRLFGERMLAHRLVLAGIGTVACALVFQLALELFDRRTALVAASVAAVMPTFVAFSVLFLSETLFATVLLASLIAMARLLRATERTAAPTEAALWAALTGAFIGFATLVRPTWLLVGPGFAVLYVLLAKHRWFAIRNSVILLGGLSLSLVPWTVRNFAVTGHFIPTTLWVGASLYDGLHPGATGASDMRFVETDGVYATHSEFDADQHYRQAAKQFIRENPLRTLELGAIKLWRFWNPLPNAEQFGSLWIALLVAVGAVPLLALAAYGAWCERHHPWHFLIPAAPVLYFSLVHIVFIGSVRYRLPVEYPLVVLAAVALCRLSRRPFGDPGTA